MDPSRLKASLVAMTMLAACAGEPAADLSASPVEGSEHPDSLQARLEAVDGVLHEGDEGDDVATVQDYLSHYGYFPNESLKKRFANWQPVVGDAPESGLFDAATRAAVVAYQHNAGLNETGIVDEEVIEMMLTPRCGVPESSEVETRQKWAHFPLRWNKTNLTFSASGTAAGLSSGQINGALTAALSVWMGVTNLTFTPTSGTADINVKFVARPPGAPEIAVTHSVWESGSGKAIVANMNLYTDVNWTVSSTPPSNGTDLLSVFVHELGHAIGLEHSGYMPAVMYWSIPTGVARRALDPEDKWPARAKYGAWTSVTAGIKQIAIGRSTFRTDVWGIGTDPAPGGFGIYRMDETKPGTWVRAPGGATRIAVNSAGVPWVINSSNEIFRRTTASPTTGSWQLMPGSAREIAIGDGDSTVWVVGTNALPKGFGIWRFNGTNGWVAPTPAISGATKIAVANVGTPWIADSVGDVYRFSASNGGSWNILPHTGAVDLAASAAGTVVFALDGRFTTAGGHPIVIWNEQPELVIGGMVRAPYASRWAGYPGGATDIAVGGDGLGVWVANSVNAVLRSR